MPNGDPNLLTMSTPMDIKVTCTIVGTGLAGLSSAAALARCGVDVALVGPPITASIAARDTRTTALFGTSIDFLRHIGVWSALDAGCEPLDALRLIDMTGALVRAPEVLFRANEIGLAHFGFNFENSALLLRLAEHLLALDNVRWVPAMADDIALSDDVTRVRCVDGSWISAPLLVAADGTQSSCRARAGIEVETWSYPQSALAARFRHSRPHHSVSNEWHYRPGPLTTVPLPGSQSSLVWVEAPEEARRLQSLDEAAFAGALEDRVGGALGRISDIGLLRTFPLTGLTARTFGRARTALIGEAGHKVPPIGAQGLNLGLRDAAWLAEIVADAMREGADPGSPAVLARYEGARRPDVTSRSLAVDMLNRTLFAGAVAGDLGRAFGIGAIAAVPALRRVAMSMGVGPSGPQPTLLRPAPA